MKLSIQRDRLLGPLQKVANVIERKQPTMAILSNVLIQVIDNNIAITGTDTEIELIARGKIEHPLTTPINLTLPGRKLVDICRTLPDKAMIELQQDKERVLLKSGRSRFTLSTLPAKDFPNTQQEPGNLVFQISQQILLGLLQRTHFSMAQQDIRYYLNGMLLEASPGQLHMVATDAHRLASNTAVVNIETEAPTSVIIPRKGVMELLRLLEDNDEPVTISLASNQIKVENNHFTFTSKLVEGRYPDYQQVIPKNCDKFIAIDRDILKRALQCTAIVCEEECKSLRFEMKNNLLSLYANTPGRETAEDALRIDYTGPDLVFGFNANYFIDILNILPEGNVNIHFSKSDSSVLIDSPNHPNSVFVVMPMRL